MLFRRKKKVEPVEVTEPIVKERKQDIDWQEAYSDYVHGKTLNDIAVDLGVETHEVVKKMEGIENGHKNQT